MNKLSFFPGAWVWGLMNGTFDFSSDRMFGCRATSQFILFCCAPDHGKIEKIANYKVPSSFEEFRSFLGLAGYYRRFISNFGWIARPLTAKTHKDVSKQSFTWTEDQADFETLRTCLTTSPIIAYPNFDFEFLLVTDACDYSIHIVSNSRRKSGYWWYSI